LGKTFTFNVESYSCGNNQDRRILNQTCTCYDLFPALPAKGNVRPVVCLKGSRARHLLRPPFAFNLILSAYYTQCRGKGK